MKTFFAVQLTLIVDASDEREAERAALDAVDCGGEQVIDASITADTERTTGGETL